MDYFHQHNCPLEPEYPWWRWTSAKQKRWRDINATRSS